MERDLFHHAAARDADGQPLAQRLRPRQLADVLGQNHLLGPDGPLTRLCARGRLPSLILWGPPGSGKTTLAGLLAARVQADLERVSAVLGGVKEVREVVARAEERRAMRRRATILFIDEIHRFNRAQQDALLPHVETGLFTLLGATTENPNFEVNPALLSRCRVFELRPLGDDDLLQLLLRALPEAARGTTPTPGSATATRVGGTTKPPMSASVGAPTPTDLTTTAGTLAANASASARAPGADDRPWTAVPAALAAIVEHSGGDARRALTLLEWSLQLAAARGDDKTLTLADVTAAGQQRGLALGREAQVQQMSALIKSLRAGEADDALAYLHGLLAAGEAPRTLMRRLLVFASEDIGLADPQALILTVAAAAALEQIGLPEGAYALTHAALYLAGAAKSRTVAEALNVARTQIANKGLLLVPSHLRLQR